MKTKQIIALGLGGLVVLGGGIALGSQLMPKEIEVPYNVTVEKIVNVEVPVEKIVTVEKNVTVEKIVEVDSPKLGAAMSFIEDNVDEDATIEYITFEVDKKIEAEDYIKKNMVDLLDDNDFFDDGEVFENFRESEVSVSKIYDAEVMDRDFDDFDLTLQFEVKVKAKESGEDATYKMFTVTIPYESEELVVDDITVELQ